MTIQDLLDFASEHGLDREAEIQIDGFDGFEDARPLMEMNGKVVLTHINAGVIQGGRDVLDT